MACCLIFYILATLIVKGSCFNDPCDQDGHRVFPSIEFGSRNERCSPKISPVCDYYLTEDWYAVENSTFLGKCPQSGNCGVSYPAWLNGTIPRVDEGEVNRTACIKQDGDCCKSHVTVIVKNCSSFLVYYIPALPTCPMAYCFESNLPCDFQTTTGKVQTDSSRTFIFTSLETTSRKNIPKDNSMYEPISTTNIVIVALILIMILSWPVAVLIGWQMRSRISSSNTETKRRVSTDNPPDYKMAISFDVSKTCAYVSQAIKQDHDKESGSSVIGTKTQPENTTDTGAAVATNPTPSTIKVKPAPEYTSGFTRVLGRNRISSSNTETKRRVSTDNPPDYKMAISSDVSMTCVYGSEGIEPDQNKKSDSSVIGTKTQPENTTDTGAAVATNPTPSTIKVKPAPEYTSNFTCVYGRNRISSSNTETKRRVSTDNPPDYKMAISSDVSMTCVYGSEGIEPDQNKKSDSSVIGTKTQPENTTDTGAAVATNPTPCPIKVKPAPEYTSGFTRVLGRNRIPSSNTETKRRVSTDSPPDDMYIMAISSDVSKTAYVSRGIEPNQDRKFDSYVKGIKTEPENMAVIGAAVATNPTPCRNEVSQTPEHTSAFISVSGRNR